MVRTRSEQWWPNPYPVNILDWQLRGHDGRGMNFPLKLGGTQVFTTLCWWYFELQTLVSVILLVLHISCATRYAEWDIWSQRIIRTRYNRCWYRSMRDYHRGIVTNAWRSWRRRSVLCHVTSSFSTTCSSLTWKDECMVWKAGTLLRYDILNLAYDWLYIMLTVDSKMT